MSRSKWNPYVETLPLGYDIRYPNGKGVFDHIQDYGDSWVFVSEDEGVEEYFEVTKDVAETRKQAEAVAQFTLQQMGFAFQTGQKHGQAEAQRFFRLALGVEDPTREERAMWNNPVPLKTDRTDRTDRG